MMLRPYQSDALARSKQRYEAGCNRQLLVLATGLGKTAVSSALRDHHGFNRKVMFLVHREELADQAAASLQRWNPHLMVGVEMAQRRARPMDTFVVASVPTLGHKSGRRIQNFHRDDFDCIIQDEAHHGTADSFKRVYDHFGLMEPNPQGPLFLGITATPNRSDGTGLRELFDEIVFDMGLREGIESGYLCDLRGITIKGEAALDNVHVRAGEFAIEELADAVNSPKRNGIIVKEWAKHSWRKKTVAFTVNVQHALDLAEAFNACTAGSVNAAAVWGDDPKRAEKLAAFRAGGIDVLCNAQLLTEGWDCPEVECIILAAPRKSELRLAQEVGRGTRTAPGKEYCLIMDVVDNLSKNSLVTTSSLLGLPKKFDAQGKSMMTAKKEMERVAKEYPTANLDVISDLSQLTSIAENITLFKPHYPPEIARLSELAWRSSGDGYMIAVNRDAITIQKDLLDQYLIKGRIADKVVELTSQNLPGAINLADNFILANGGAKQLLAREANWKNQPPSEKQIAICRKHKILIPVGASRGMVSAALDSHFAGARR